jgi:hypothetical protein
LIQRLFCRMNAINFLCIIHSKILYKWVPQIPYLLEYKTIFFPDSSSKKLSYNRAQSSKNRVNVSVISNTMNNCLGWVVQLFCCIIFFVLSHTTRPHVWQHPWIGECFFQ